MRGLISRRQFLVSYLIGIFGVIGATAFFAGSGIRMSAEYDSLLFTLDGRDLVLPPLDVVVWQSGEPPEFNGAIASIGWPAGILSFQHRWLNDGMFHDLPASWAGPWDRVVFHLGGMTFDLLFGFALSMPLLIIAKVRHWNIGRRLTRGLCAYCAYDLTGNESGRCSECGALTHANALRQWSDWMKTSVFTIARFVAILVTLMFAAALLAAAFRGCWISDGSGSPGEYTNGRFPAYNWSVVYGPLALFAVSCVAMLCRQFVRSRSEPRRRSRLLRLSILALACLGAIHVLRGCTASIAFFD